MTALHESFINDPGRARDALLAIDASCPREKWVRLGMAAKGAGLTFDDFHQWSKDGENYKSEDDCVAVWRSFNENGGITEATLYDEAYRQGWVHSDTAKLKPKPIPHTPHNPVKKNPDNNPALKAWNLCIPAPPYHPYIVSKLGTSEGVSVYPVDAPPLLIKKQDVAGWLAVPAWSDGQLQTLQFIPPNGGEKLNHPGASFNDGYFSVGNMPNNLGYSGEIYVVEGIGQAWASNLATGSPAVSCFGAGRMQKVAKVLRAKYPNAILIIVPDRGKESEAAKIAAAVSGCYVAMPDDKPSNYDVNDYMLEFGVDALPSLLSKTQSPNQAKCAQISPTESTYNATLDAESKYFCVDLLKHVADDHLLKRLSMQISAETHIPANTVFLMGLTVFSSMAARKYSVLYPNGEQLPIGIYAVAEQPSGSAKSRCLKSFERPFWAIQKKLKNTIATKKKQFDRRISNGETLSDQENEDYKVIIKKMKRLNLGLFITNATSEGLETTLENSQGFFSAVSSEQGLFNTLFGNCYKPEGASNNNDVVLNGFDGGTINSVRAKRDGYSGDVVGGIACFAQPGSTEIILKASNGTGLSERFVMLSEPHNLGKRDHTKEIFQDTDLLNDYLTCCELLASVINEPLEFENLNNLTINKSCFFKINEYRNRIEPHLADGARFTHVSLRGAASKIDMQIMKIAANMHLMDYDFNNVIPERHVTAAIDIANELLDAKLKLCMDKGILGVKAEFTAILSLFENNPKPRTERNIIQAKFRQKPFSEYSGNVSELIRTNLAEMVDQKLLKQQYEPEGAVLYSLGQ